MFISNVKAVAMFCEIERDAVRGDAPAFPASRTGNSPAGTEAAPGQTICCATLSCNGAQLVYSS